MNVFVNTAKISLTQKDYVAEGGEGVVYRKGDIGYKIYHDPKKMLPLGKIKELSVISNPNIIRPVNVIVDACGNNIGYTMRFIKDSWAMCQAFTRPFRDRHGISHDMIRNIVLSLKEIFDTVHKADILIVDANEMNFLLSKDFKTVYGIDADSYQTKHYPCPAIMPSIRDWTITPPNWTEGSDWFSFACVSFQLFTGVHPYKGQHPTVKKMEEMMKANISVFDKDVKIPKVAYDFSVIPKPYLDWYKNIFVKGERTCPPQDFAGTPVYIAPVKIKKVGTGSLVVMTEIFLYDSDIVRFWVGFGQNIVQTKNRIWINKQQYGLGLKTIHGLGFTNSGKPVIAESSNEGKLNLYCIPDQKEIIYNCDCEEVNSCDGRIYFRNGDHVFELILTEVGNSIIASSKIAVNISSNSSKLFRGFVYQSLLGSVFISCLEKGGAAYQIRIPELDKYRFIDGSYENGVLMAIVEKNGRYNRMIFRFDENFSTYDIRIIADIQPQGLNFTVLDSGVCVSFTEEEKLELFSKKKDSKALKEIDDKSIPDGICLGKDSGVLLFSDGNKLSSMKMQ